MGEVDLSKSGSRALLASFEALRGEAEKAHSTTPFRWKRCTPLRLFGGKGGVGAAFYFSVLWRRPGLLLSYLEQS